MLELVIIGAPRSGTNMLRDVLCGFPEIATWPCDEINYIWRHRNIRHPSDALPSDKATPPVQRYIKKQFQWVAKTYNASIVVEKTCANCLRIPFVDKVIPEARYIYIYRDGIDATGSARLRWSAELDIPYLLQKVRFVPFLDLPYYALRYLWSRLYRLFSSDKRLAFWGPKLEDMNEILKNHTLNEVCAIQWQRCVDQADIALSAMPVDKVFRLKYEDFVTHPESELSRILDFLGYRAPPEAIAEAVKSVSSNSLGKGRKYLGDDEVRHLESLVSGALRRYGYL